jgi:hypothetical protein
VKQLHIVETLLEQNARLSIVLARLVQKIDAEAARGCPLSPADDPDSAWEGDFPEQLEEARALVKELQAANACNIIFR